MTNHDYTSPTAIRQRYLKAQTRLDRRAIGAVGTGMNDTQARQFVHKLTLERVANLSKLRDAIHDLVADRYDYHIAVSSYLADALASALSGGQIKDDLRSIGQYWLDVLAQVEDGTLPEGLVGDSDYQARVEAQMLAEQARDLVRERYNDQADAKLDEICERLDDPSIPDTIPAIIEFWQGIIAEIQPSPQPLASTLYDLARQCIETHTQWSSGETRVIYQTKTRTVSINAGSGHNGGLLYLALRNGDPRKAIRVQAGHLSPMSGWQFTLTESEYKRWVERAQKI